MRGIIIEFSVFSFGRRVLRMVYRSFEELEVWKRSCQLAVDVYRSRKDCHDNGLRDQMQRAAISIPSNIAEGCERGGKDFIRFIRIALGFAAELRTPIYIARKVCMLTESSTAQLIPEVKEVSRMLNGLRRSLTIEHRPPSN